MNIGGYDDNAFSESDGNRLLGGILEQTKLIKVHFSEGDKTPNIDGFFELCVNAPTKKIPVGRFNVQIKTMTADYCNNNKIENISDYKYSCDTKIFNYVKSGCSHDPAILFLVDIINKKVFPIHVSPEYVLSLDLKNEGTKVIYFNESDCLNDETFYDQFNQINISYRQLLCNENGNTLTISERLDTKTVTELQEMVDNLNNLFSNELQFIKHHFYPNIWKFGIAYVKHDDVSATIGIYQVQKGENGILIRKFSKEDITDFETIAYFKLDKKTTKEIIDDFLFRIIDEYFEHAYINPSFLPKNILEEIAFYFLDSIATYCETFSRNNQRVAYYKDVVSTKEVCDLWRALIEYSLETSSYFSLVSDDEKYAGIKIDPLDSLHSGYDIEARQKLFESIVKNPTGKRTKRTPLIFEGEFAYRLVQRTIEELKSRNISIVSRIWLPRDLDKFFQELEAVRASGMDRYETGYAYADFSENLQKLLAILPNAYLHVTHSLLGKHAADIKINNEYLIYVERTHEARCTIIELPSSDFSLSQIDKIEENDSDDIRNITKELYPNYNSITKTYMRDAFLKPYPLYRNVSYLIKKSIYCYFNKHLPYSSGFHPIIR